MKNLKLVVHNTINAAYCMLCKTGNQGECTFDILKEEVMWLGAHAFLQILRKKENYHQGVLAHFKEFFEDFWLKNTHLLNSIVDWNLSSIFNEMKKF
ncbi:hypothetical protein C1645_533001 [Glomus cerebriforme]|uniref:Uncharacterized protein n=1 Tax=Glomus cerebriforme TaxID=658196 RepID=A0A397TEM3_9GLOM|nr:hypothetical protein C1645_533001 [Glomus cerebriforme]